MVTYFLYYYYVLIFWPPHTHTVYTPKDRETDKLRSFTFIKYRRPENAEEAIRGMNGRVRVRKGRRGWDE